MERAVFVGIDAGTTGVTVSIYDQVGTEVASGYQEFTVQGLFIH